MSAVDGQPSGPNTLQTETGTQLVWTEKSRHITFQSRDCLLKQEEGTGVEPIQRSQAGKTTPRAYLDSTEIGSITDRDD
jgi:hypothetical protein